MQNNLILIRDELIWEQDIFIQLVGTMPSNRITGLKWTFTSYLIELFVTDVPGLLVLLKLQRSRKQVGTLYLLPLE